MRIWLIQTGEPLPVEQGVRKMRTGILADVLVERGHNVHWWVSAFEHQRKRMLWDKDQEVPLSNHLTLQVLRGCGYRKNVSFARYLDHRIVAYKFLRKAPEALRPDAIVASIPCHHLAYAAVSFAHEKKIPVLVDIRDLWPDIFIDQLKSKLLKKIGQVALIFDIARLKFLLERADGLLSVSQGYLDWALSKTGRKKNDWDRVLYLGYNFRCNQQNGIQYKRNPHWLEDIHNKKVIVFMGTFGVSYELTLLLQVAKKMQEKGRNDVCFVLAGTGQQAEIIQKMASKLSNVILPGWIGAEEIGTLLNMGYMGLVPCRSTENTIPNKVFEYLSVGLPLISSLEGEMSELILRHHIGLNYRPGRGGELCQALESLLDNPDLRDKMSANARSFFKAYGDADKIYKDYAKHIEELVEAKKY
jgi:glycosyltransferase involved in cell wall biosynthesis